jgi:hypothetical protein
MSDEIEIREADENDPIYTREYEFKMASDEDMALRRYKPCGAESCCFTGDREYVLGLEEEVLRLQKEVHKLNLELAIMLEPDIDAKESYLTEDVFT